MNNCCPLYHTGRSPSHSFSSRSLSHTLSCRASGDGGRRRGRHRAGSLTDVLEKLIAGPVVPLGGSTRPNVITGISARNPHVRATRKGEQPRVLLWGLRGRQLQARHPTGGVCIVPREGVAPQRVGAGRRGRWLSGRRRRRRRGRRRRRRRRRGRRRRRRRRQFHFSPSRHSTETRQDTGEGVELDKARVLTETRSPYYLDRDARGETHYGTEASERRGIIDSRV